jgi:NAD(P)-dependent dehydrogenase (short-subunit alcohol dehydrogenase family)
MSKPIANETSRPLALVVGASRGLGVAIVEELVERGWQVVATVRGNARTALHALAERAGGRIEIETVDIAEREEIVELRWQLAGRRFDLLFVNAGMMPRVNDSTAADISDDEFARLMLTNTLGPLRVLEELECLVPADGIIGVMSSGLGSIARNHAGMWPLYGASKTALNQLVRSFAMRRPNDPRPMVLIAPGWVRTDMGGPSADLSIDQSVPKVVDVITAQRGKAGLAYLDYQGEVVPW